jgi:hypothetical protein
MLAGILLTAVALGAGTPAPAPALELTAVQPVAVHGTGFPAHRRVTVRLRAPGVDRRRHPRTSAAGAFRSAFTMAPVDRCSAFTVVAKAKDGSLAKVVHRAKPACAPATPG